MQMTAIVTYTVQDLQTLIWELNRATIAYGLIINEKKTEVIYQLPPDQPLHLLNIHLE